MRTVVSVLCGVVLVVCLVVLGPAIALRQTVLNADFVTARMELVDAPTLIADQLKQQLPPDTEWLHPVIDTATTDLESWSNEQLATLARSAIGYIKGEQEFRAVVSLTELKTYLQLHLGDLLEQLPTDVLPFPPAQMEMFIGLAASQVSSMVPDVLEIDESYLDEETLAQLQTARDYTATLRTILSVTPVVAAVMVLAIVLVQRFHPRPTLRHLGVPLAIGGLSCLVLALLIPSLVWGAVAGRIPPEVTPLVPGIVSDCCQPLYVYSGILLLVGIGTVGLSFVFRRED